MRPTNSSNKLLILYFFGDRAASEERSYSTLSKAVERSVGNCLRKTFCIVNSPYLRFEKLCLILSDEVRSLVYIGISGTSRGCGTIPCQSAGTDNELPMKSEVKLSRLDIGYFGEEV